MNSRRLQHLNRLGLGPEASLEDIKKAYRVLAKRLHPDLNPSASAEKQFIELQEAYEYLINKPKVEPQKPTLDELRKKRRAEAKAEHDRLKAEAQKRAKAYSQRLARTLLSIYKVINVPVTVSLVINLFLLTEWILPLQSTQRPLLNYVTHVSDQITREKELSYYFYLQFDHKQAVIEGDLGYQLKDQLNTMVNLNETTLSGIVESVELKTSNGTVWVTCSSYFFYDFSFLILLVTLQSLLYTRMSPRNRFKIHVGIFTLLMLLVEILALQITPY